MGLIIVLLLAAVATERVPIFQEIDAFFAENRTVWIWLASGMAVLGTLLLVGAQLVVRHPKAEELSEEALGEDVKATFSSMRHAEVEETIASVRRASFLVAIWRRYRYRLRGRFVGRSFHVEAPLRAVKHAWRTGTWQRNPVWQLFTLMAFGGMLMALGLFGLGIVLPSPPVVKLFCAGALVYAISRTIWAIKKA
jgi:hypothetical protein